MSVDQKHPEYVNRRPDWDLMSDSYRGQRAVKQKRFTYLPATSGQIFDGITATEQPGTKAYESYIIRARYPGHVRQAVQTAIGMMHHNPAEISVPKALKPMLTNASTEGESLQDLLRRINEQQLINGRVGMMLDLPIQPKVGEDTPFIAVYLAETIINWDSGSQDDLTKKTLNLVILDETEKVRQSDFTWEDKTSYRVLTLGDLEANEREGVYRVAVVKDDNNFNPDDLQTPVWRGNELKEIPFVFINACDLLPSPDEPPLLDLANLAMTIYRGEADYRQSLFMQGQDTLVVTGGTSVGDGEELRTGAGARIDVPMQGDAKYIGVSANGLSEQRSALENDNQLAGSMGAQSIDTVSRERESGTSLHTRIAARTADLNQLADAGAQGLVDILRIAATWVGADPNEVIVKPNKDFGDVILTGQTFLEWQTAKTKGAPVSGKTMHQMLVDKGQTEMTFEQELAAIKSEAGGPLDVSANEDVNTDQ